MKCNKCGNVNPDGAPQCLNCGAPLLGTSQQPSMTPPPGGINYNGGQYYGGGMPRPRNNNNVLLIVIIALLVVLIAGIAVIALVDDDPAPAPAQEATTTVHDTVVVRTETVVPVAPAASTTSTKSVPRTRANSAYKASGGDYSWVCTTRLSGADLAGLSRSELRVMRNTIYARHGYIFSSADLNNYFSRFSWYNPYTKVVPERELSSIEKANINLIKAYE